MMKHFLIVFISFIFFPSVALAEVNKLPANCVKALLIVLDDKRDDREMYVEKSTHESSCGIDENKPNEVYLIFHLKPTDEKGRNLVSRPSYRINIENKTIVEFKGRA